MEKEMVVLTRKMVDDLCRAGGMLCEKRIMFAKGASFAGRIIAVPINFTGSTFGNTALFEGTIFKSASLLFSETTWEEGVAFKGAFFETDAFFKKVTFHQGVNFIEATFKGNAFFQETVFGTGAWFQKTTFEGEVNFEEATFMETMSKLHFEGVTFKKWANLAFRLTKGTKMYTDNPLVARSLAYAQQGIIISPNDLVEQEIPLGLEVGSSG